MVLLPTKKVQVNFSSQSLLIVLILAVILFLLSSFIFLGLGLYRSNQIIISTTRSILKIDYRLDAATRNRLAILFAKLGLPATALSGMRLSLDDETAVRLAATLPKRVALSVQDKEIIWQTVAGLNQPTALWQNLKFAPNTTFAYFEIATPIDFLKTTTSFPQTLADWLMGGLVNLQRPALFFSQRENGTDFLLVAKITQSEVLEKRLEELKELVNTGGITTLETASINQKPIYNLIFSGKDTTSAIYSVAAINGYLLLASSEDLIRQSVAVSQNSDSAFSHLPRITRLVKSHPTGSFVVFIQNPALFLKDSQFLTKLKISKRLLAYNFDQLENIIVVSDGQIIGYLILK